MPLLNVRGTTISCKVEDSFWPWEKHEKVLLHHGFARNADFWNPWVRNLAVDHAVYRPEVRGCGDSAPVAPGYVITAEEIVADVLAVMDALEIERCHWIGEHSGTLLGLALTAQAPDRIASLVLCDAPTQRPSTVTNAIGESSNAAALRKYGCGEWCRRTIGHRLDPKLSTPEMREWYATQMDRVPGETGAMLTEAFHEVRVNNKIPFEKISAPVLLLSGDQSAFGTFQANQDLAKRLPNARLEVLKGVGEGVNFIAPDACLAAARKFWASLG